MITPILQNGMKTPAIAKWRKKKILKQTKNNNKKNKKNYQPNKKNNHLLKINPTTKTKMMNKARISTITKMTMTSILTSQMQSITKNKKR